MNGEADKKSLWNSTRSVLGWAFGISFCIAGFVGVVSSDFILGVFLILIGLMLIPYFWVFLKKKFGFELTGIKKVLLVVAGFILLAFASGSSNSSQKAQEQSVASSAETPEAVVSPIASTEIPSKPIEAVPQEAPSIENQSDIQKTFYPVLRVVDGDTLAVEIDGKQEVLRLMGINTPETVDPRKPVECFGKEASDKAKEILTGKKVSLENDASQGERDKYNRLLRYVFLEDDTNFNKLMIEEGYAYEYTYNIPYKYQVDFKVAQQKAQEGKKGLWADDTCSGKMTKPNPTAVPTTKPVSSMESASIPVPVSLPVKNESGSTYACNCSKTCPQMSSCAEAQYQLATCGCSKRDADHDGIACDADCQ